MRNFRYQTATAAVAVVAGAALILAACGGETSNSAELSADSGETPTTAASAETPVVEEEASAEPTTEEPAAEESAAEESAEEEPVTEEPAEEEPAAEEPAEEEEEAAVPVDPEAAADANLPLLAPSDNVIDFQVLDVADGSISTLSDAVVGDRPVLLWFFAPH